MATYVRIFSNPDVADIHVKFAAIIREITAVEAARRRAGLPPVTGATRAAVLRAYKHMNDRLDATASRTAADSVKRIQAQLKATAKRPDTGLRPHLRNGIVSRPLHRFGPVATGEVGVAAIESLDKVRNPTSPSYGPYWRAQEFGTGSPEVKTQKGRHIYGYFFEGGLTNPARPTKGRSDQPIFVSGRAGGLPSSVKGGTGPKGGRGGPGVIGREIEGRHFIRDGADRARAEWLRGIRQVERETVRELSPVFNARAAASSAAARRARRTQVRRPRRF